MECQVTDKMDIATAQSMVLETLHRAANQNAEILKPAELKLKEWETEPGFYSILLVRNKYNYFHCSWDI